MEEWAGPNIFPLSFFQINSIPFKRGTGRLRRNCQRSARSCGNSSDKRTLLQDWPAMFGLPRWPASQSMVVATPQPPSLSARQSPSSCWPSLGGLSSGTGSSPPCQRLSWRVSQGWLRRRSGPGVMTSTTFHTTTTITTIARRRAMVGIWQRRRVQAPTHVILHRWLGDLKALQHFPMQPQPLEVATEGGRGTDQGHQQVQNQRYRWSKMS